MSCGLVASDQGLGGNWGSPVTQRLLYIKGLLASGWLGRGAGVPAELNASRETMGIVETWSMLGKEGVKELEGFFQSLEKK